MERGLDRMIANTDGGVTTRASGTLIRRWASPSGRPIADRLDRALGLTRDWLVANQHPEGFWVGELEGDTILESEYVLLMAFLGRGGDEVCVKACRYLLEHQDLDGGWSIYPGGPPDISASVKAYFALKIVGVPVDDPAMRRAREVLLEAGGAQACNSFTRFYLALLGQISYDECPSVPREIVLVPSRLGFSLSAMSAWTRTIVVPLSIISAFKPVRALPPEQGIAELFRDDLPAPSRRSRRLVSWTNFFLGVDRLLKWADRRVPASSPVEWALRQLEDLLIEEGGKVRVQPCVSPVWDTAIATIALADAQLTDYHPCLLRAVRWLLEKEVRVPGDWQVRRPGIEPSGWHFQFSNERYPDIDDTAMVLLALQRSSLSGTPEDREATRRGVNW